MKLSVCLTFLANLFLLATGESAMEKLKVVPDIIDNPPKAFIEVSYPSGKKVDNGNTLTPTDVHEQPTVKWTADEGKLYTLLLTDPDAPSRKEPKFREWHHWLVGNIPGSAVEKGDVLSQYIGSAPPQGTGKHRYVFLVFQQPGKVSFTDPKLTNKSGANRGKFNTRNFANKYQLGDPVAGNVYEAEYDDYVPKIYKQLEGK